MSHRAYGVLCQGTTKVALPAVSRMKLMFVAATLTAILFGTTASADVVSVWGGNELLGFCNASRAGDASSQRARCWGYIEAVSDAMNAGAIIGGFRACVPLGVQTSQLQDIVVPFLVANPARRHYGGALLVAEALAQGFPCQ